MCGVNEILSVNSTPSSLTQSTLSMQLSNGGIVKCLSEGRWRTISLVLLVLISRPLVSAQLRTWSNSSEIVTGLDSGHRIVRSSAYLL